MRIYSDVRFPVLKSYQLGSGDPALSLSPVKLSGFFSRLLKWLKVKVTMNAASSVLTVFRCPCGTFIPSPEGIDGHLGLCSRLQEDMTDVVECGREAHLSQEDARVDVGTLVNFYPPSLLLERLSESTLNGFRRQVRECYEGNENTEGVSEDQEIKSEAKFLADNIEAGNMPSFVAPPPRRSSVRALQNLRKLIPVLTGKDEKTDLKEERKDTEFENLSEPRPKKRRKNTSHAVSDDQFIHRCALCPTKFKTDKDFEWHMYNIHGEGSKKFEIITCPLCQRMLNKRLVFLSHLKSHENAEAVEDAFDLWNKWPPIKRVKGKTISMKFNCKYCLIPHSTQHSFLSHMELEHKGKGRFSIYLCPICKTSEFDSMKTFLIHFRQSHPDECYGKTIKWSLSNPLKQVGRPKGRCDYCKKMIDVYYLRAHIERLHRPKTEKRDGKIKVEVDDHNTFSCPVENCFSTFKSRTLLKSHFILHLENNPFQCTFPGCNVKCDAECHLNRHMKLHTSKLLTCPKCHVSYSRKDKLKNHVCVYDPSKLICDSNGHVRHHNSQLRLKRAFLQDDVLQDSDGNDSSSGPDKMSADIEDNDSNDETKSVEMSSNSLKRRKNNKTRVDINSMISSDPVFQKVCQTNPGFRELILNVKKHRKTQANRKTRTKSSRKKASASKKSIISQKSTTETCCSNLDYSIVKIEIEPEVIINDCDMNTQVSEVPVQECLIKTEPLDYPSEIKASDNDHNPDVKPFAL